MKCINRRKILNVTYQLGFVLVLSTSIGCAALQVGLSKKNLEVQTKMSESIFLDPVEPEQQTIYVRVRNTSDKDLDLHEQVVAKLLERGFQVTHSPQKARYRLQANVLSVEKASKDAAEAARSAGYGANVGAAVAIAHTDPRANYQEQRRNVLLGWLIGGAGEFVAGRFVKDVTYLVVTDIELVEKAPNGAYVRTDTQIRNTASGTGSSHQRVSNVGDDIEYRTRIVSTASKVNLAYEDAHQQLAQGIARSLSGLF